MKPLLLALMLLVASPCWAWRFAEDWSVYNTGLEIANAGLTALDYGQSMRIQRNPGRYHEEDSEWCIGEHPSRGEYNILFAALLIGKPIVSALLPQEIETRWFKIYPRYIWQNLMIVNGAIVYSNNRREGL